jgi:LytS/YehU family sensor histidine kinase
MLPAFYVLNIFMITGLFFLYGRLPVVGCVARPEMVVWTILYACIMSTMITFINEAVVNWEAWKASLTETEKLKNAYQRSRVLGLRGQLNPHFLFNCFNTLSGLIQEDEAKAERFLNEMTKVHRYLLRSDDELLVSLDMELKFAESYLYLAGERFGEAIKYRVAVQDGDLERELPPLSLQVILEHIIYTNALSKTSPLHIEISSGSGHQLSVVNTLHKKAVTRQYDADYGLDNLVNKYKMLNAGDITIHEEGGCRTILLPLFHKKEELL